MALFFSRAGLGPSLVGPSLLGFLLLTSGCSRKEELPPSPAAAVSAAASAALAPTAPEPPPGHPPTNAGAGAAADAPKGKELAWTAPDRFRTAPNPSPMRKATYKVASAPSDTEEAELSVSQAGGSVDANITRWVGQFEGGESTLKRAERTVNGLKVTVVDVKGTYSGGMPGMGGGGPKKGWALKGAIVDGETPYFFKLTGPEKTVAAAGPDFDKLIGSLRKE